MESDTLVIEGQSIPQRRQGERRRLWDRRSPFPRRASDRRHGERRRGSDAAPQERRATDRRRGDRRDASDRRQTHLRRMGRRRRETPTPYTAEEITQLRARFAAPGPVFCPCCNGRFTLGPGKRRGTDTARRVVCLGCGRAAVMPNTRIARLLLVGSRAEVRDALRIMLVDAGHEIIEAPDAEVALMAYQTVPADVVILDAVTPGRLEAPEFLRRLRKVFPDARVVAMAGRASYNAADRLAITQGLGAMKTIRMPIMRDELLRIVDEVRA